MRRFLASSTFALAALIATPLITRANDPAAPAQPPAEATPVVETPGAAEPKLFGPPTPSYAPILDADSARVAFQARLTTPQGDPLPGATANLSFQLYTSGGAAVGVPIVMNNVPMTDGIVDALVPVPTSSISGAGRQIGVSVNGGAELTPRLPIGAVPHAYRVDRVSSPELDDQIELGAPATPGYLAIYGLGATPTFVVEAAMGTASLLNPNNSFAISMSSQNNSGYLMAHNNGINRAYFDGNLGQIWAESSLNVGDIGANLVNAVHGRLSSNSWGGWLQLWDENSSTAMRMGASSSASGGGFMEIYRGAGGTSIFMDGEDVGGSGLLQVRNGTVTTVELNGNDSRLLTFGSTGAEHARLGGTGSGNLQLRGGGASNVLTVNALGGGTGGQIDLSRTTGTLGARLQGGTSTTGGSLFVYNASAVQTGELAGDTTSGGASLTLRDSSTDRIVLDADAQTIALRDNNLDVILLDAGKSGDGGAVLLDNGTGTQTIELDGDESDRGVLRVRGSAGGSGVTLDGGENAGAGGQVAVFNATGQATVELDGENGSGNSVLNLRRSDGSSGISMNSNEGGVGADINLYNALGQVAIQIDTNWNSGADSRIVVDELQIAGGSDLSEQFDVSDVDGKVEPGMVVCIDAANPGKLRVSNTPYDRTVAGIVSGAGGVRTGMYMGQKGSVADGQLPIALTGRVYCYVDADQGAIEPGDLLTTSSTPGHAMKANDATLAGGAIIGKAMTRLESGKGLVLVLVNLQ